jgi:8-oxo-dGTP diphosphatase
MSLLTSAVVAVLSDDAGHVLLCQQSSGHRRWHLPGGRIRPGESPRHAIRRELFAETGLWVELVDLVGLYQLTGHSCGEDVPDVVMHAFRARMIGGEAVVNEPGRISRATWYAHDAIPAEVTATTRAALADAAAGRSGVLADVQRDPEPEPVDPEASPSGSPGTDATVSDDAAMAAV